MTDAAPPPHTRRPPEVWIAARNDYESGASVRIIAERYDLNIRTVTRHARAEGWEAPRVSAAEAYDMTIAEQTHDPSAFLEQIAVGHVARRDEETLLLCPDSRGLCRFAFRRAAECASVGGPTEALAWVRLAEATARLRRNVDVDVRPMTEADYRRVAALARAETDAELEAIAAAPPESRDGDQDARMSEVSESVP